MAKKKKARIKKTFRGLNALDIILMLFIIGFFALSDVNKNAIDTEGLDATVRFKEGTNVKAITMFWFGAVAIFLMFAFMSLRNIINKKGIIARDVIFGFVGLGGFVLWFATATTGFYSDPAGMFFIFGTPFPIINVYHFGGIPVMLFSVFYFALFE